MDKTRLCNAISLVVENISTSDINVRINGFRLLRLFCAQHSQAFHTVTEKVFQIAKVCLDTPSNTIHQELLMI
jgi:hypothetical protein